MVVDSSDSKCYDEEFIHVEQAPTLDELTTLSRRNLLAWLEYLRSDPPLRKLKTNASKIMDDIQMASGLRGIEDLAAEVALAADSKFERLGLWRAWHPRLWSLYAPVVDSASSQSQTRLFQCFMNYYLHQGDLVRANQVIHTLLDIAESDPNTQLRDIWIGVVSIAALSNDDNGLVLAQQLLELAQLTGDILLLGKTFSVLCQFYTYRYSFVHVLEYGQMAYGVGVRLADDNLIINGLHYMALGLADRPRHAFTYLRDAMIHCSRSGDASHLMYLRYSWGYCCYLAGRYRPAAYFLSRSLRSFTRRGTYYATVLYMLGLALMQLRCLDKAEQRLKQAASEWAKAKRPFEQLYAKHALAHVHWLGGRSSAAVRQAEHVLDQLAKVKDPRRKQLRDEVTKDLKKYRGRAKVPAGRAGSR